jgi:hypothetical protein
VRLRFQGVAATGAEIHNNASRRDNSRFFTAQLNRFLGVSRPTPWMHQAQ